jgi:RNA polymerase sigma-70 factor (ECF subfamily)
MTASSLKATGASMKLRTQDNAAVLAQLVREHKKAVFAVAYAKLRNIHDAEDVTQDVFVEAYRNLGRLKDIEKIRPWLHKVTLNRCADNLRKTRRREMRERAYSASAPDNPIGDVRIAEERRGIVLEEIGALSEKHRVVVMLKYFAKLSYDDIAKTTGLSKVAVSNRLQAAKRILRASLNSSI